MDFYAVSLQLIGNVFYYVDPLNNLYFLKFSLEEDLAKRSRSAEHVTIT